MPAFGLLDNLVAFCQNSANSVDDSLTLHFDVSWLRLAFYNALNHVNAFIVKWAVGKYFDADPHALKAIVGETDYEVRNF